MIYQKVDTGIIENFDTSAGDTIRYVDIELVTGDGAVCYGALEIVGLLLLLLLSLTDMSIFLLMSLFC